MDLTKINEMSDYDGCSGWRSEEECPYDGKFNKDAPECKDCEKDAMDTMKEEIIEIQTDNLMAFSCNYDGSLKCVLSKFKEIMAKALAAKIDKEIMEEFREQRKEIKL